ncbi:hypothetical protein [Bifidobacterium breve]|uniref:hypothetical protein n=1 Tax=Bifidobacterium breve TaxID=1685 RepID=UPI0032E01B80
MNSYQRIVREHHRDTAELLAYRYLPTDDPTAIRTLIARKERQISKLRDEVDRLKLILPEHDTGKPENRHTGMTEQGKRNSLAYPTSKCCGTHRRNT